ncbi:MAG: hypothetical protein ACKO1V_09900 [Cyanobium sp.]
MLLLVLDLVEQGLALRLGIAELGCGGGILQLPLLLDLTRRRPADQLFGLAEALAELG